MQLVSSYPPSYKAWVLRGLGVGLAVGILAFTAGVVWSRIDGDAEKLELVSLLIAGLTLPWSLISVWLSERQLPWAVVELFIVAPAIQGAVVASLLWLIDAGIRRTRGVRAA